MTQSNSIKNKSEELIDRFFEPNRKFSVQETKKIVGQILNLGEIETTDRFHNPFFHEICPLLFISEYLNDSSIYLSFVGNNKRFDGLIYSKLNSSGQKVELTAAIDGHNDSLGMELLKQRGHTPAFQNIECEGPKKNRKFGENLTIAISRDGYIDRKLKPLMTESIKKKIEKAETNPDYANSWLGIVFDDYFFPNNKECLPSLCEEVLSDHNVGIGPFARTFFVGVSGKFIHDSAHASF